MASLPNFGFACRTLAFVGQFPCPWSWSLVIGSPWSMVLVVGSWSLVLDAWSLVLGPEFCKFWSLVPCHPEVWPLGEHPEMPISLVLGPWSMVLGPWSLVLGPGPWPPCSLLLAPWSSVVIVCHGWQELAGILARVGVLCQLEWIGVVD